MNRVDRAFADARANGWDALLIPFVCAGDPSLDVTERCLVEFPRAGASIVEVGIPFSDPIADGPTISSAMHRALGSGMRVRDVMRVVKRARAQTDAAFVAMVSCSIARRFGAEPFAGMLAEAGFDGVIYPDLPLEEAEPFATPARAAGLTVSLLISPATPPARASAIAGASSGFVYAMARVGITGGEGSGGPADLSTYLNGLRGGGGVPVACGFGIATPVDARAIAAVADGVIVGSAIVKAMAEAHGRGEDAAGAGVDLVRSLASAAHGSCASSGFAE
ncbi:MAG: tryptophan synthase subunit alpha [Phycisphaerales bacterium]